MSDKNYNRIKIVLAEKNLPNKYLAEKLGRDQAAPIGHIVDGIHKSCGAVSPHISVQW